ncbi:MAG: hypothetical protein HY858_11355 [Candidatus Solibacter usitatus]|nr:hypothetical protein [Candidatus Solibacter usitatus]
MAKITLPGDFSEFLRLFNSHGVEYLLVGGHAVGIHGYVRATNDLDVWVKASVENAARIERALREFGFDDPSLSPGLFTARDNIVRMGVPPMRLEVHTSISGVEFDACYAEREMFEIGAVMAPVISLARLRENKAAAGRAKDLADLENLPG